MRSRLWDQDWFADAVWSADRVVGINLHFITAFLDRYVKDDASRAAYLDGLVPDSPTANGRPQRPAATAPTVPERRRHGLERLPAPARGGAGAAARAAAMSRDLSCRYRVVDVFTRQALEGNPLAVFPDAAHLDAMTMQRIARELNLPETTFVLPVTRDDCVARVRIFTPAREMAFAGHPTLGTSFVLWEEGRLSGAGHAFNLEEQVGPVPVRIGPESPPLLWLGMPPVHDGPRFARDPCARALGLGLQDLLEFEPQLLSAGNPTIVVPLRDRDAVDRAWLDESGSARCATPEANRAVSMCSREPRKASIPGCSHRNTGSSKTPRRAVRPGRSRST